MSQDKESKTGYKNPPKKTRFKKGQSGNPKGRPKVERLDIEAMLDEVLSEIVVVREGGKKREITKIKAAIIQLANKAAGGDLRAFDYMRKLYVDIKRKELGEKNEPLPWNDD